MPRRQICWNRFRIKNNDSNNQDIVIAYFKRYSNNMGRYISAQRDYNIDKLFVINSQN